MILYLLIWALRRLLRLDRVDDVETTIEMAFADYDTAMADAESRGLVPSDGRVLSRDEYPDLYAAIERKCGRWST